MKRILTATLLGAMFLAPLAANAGEVYNREANQHARIAQGVRNGTISPAEYRKLQAREARLNRTRERDLRRNDGRLTPAEYRQLNRMENRDSRAIYRDKHNQ